MPFKEGNKLGSGRPKGSPNVINQAGRELMHAFFTDNFNELAQRFRESKMSDSQKWQILLKMAEFIYPKQRAVMMDVDIDAMSDAAVGSIIAQFIEIYGPQRDITKDSPKGDNTAGDNR